MDEKKYLTKKNKLHILIMEASPTARKTQSRTLMQAGHTVVIAETDAGAYILTAVEKCFAESNRPFDVVTVSMFFGTIDGADAVLRIRQLGYDGLIFGVTGNLESDESDRVLSCGADGVLAKPIDLESFNNAVKGDFIAIFDY